MVLNREYMGRFLAKYGIYAAFLLLVIILSITSSSFLTVQNIFNILRQASISGIIAVGMTFVIIRGGIDLSVGSILAFSAVVASSFAQGDAYPLIVPVALGLLAGLLLGGINGIIISRWNVAPFIVTLGMMTAARGLTMVYTDGRPIINLNDSYNRMGGGYVAGIPIPVLIFILVILLGIFILHITKFGRHVYAAGGNEHAARLSGVNVNYVQVAVYAISGLAAGLAGILLSSRVMTGSPVLGIGYELDAIAAVVIGGTSLAGGRGTIVGTVIGVLIIGIMNNGLDLLNVSSYYQQIVKGVIIVLAVLLDKKSH
ncbi:ABC transporter permease [Paenibacillus naphthalenovorans]|uniref:ABC transporter permease n=1 Tax=Paenibacillus naphthalenovorans TaxID=162209 RepID=UPI000885E1FF|nr:ribose ABC transporter permease [Paenibacillus naphthalenovorans]SDJ38297.1 putative xylitol transport system permease protein/inositol transport system permease protein [Paenibacillus naphthalenovorans]